MRSLVLFFAAIATMNFPTTSDAEPPVNWSIAIHGGAGGSPDKWDDAKKQARTVGLEKALTAGKLVLAKGGAAIDAVEAAIRVLEDDASFMGVAALC